MHAFRATLVPGRKPPYTTWTFIELPDEVAGAFGPGSHAVRGTLSGVPFRGTVSRSGGVLRMPVRRELIDSAGVLRGDAVDVTLEPDPEPRPDVLPAELRAVLDGDPEAARLFAALPPAHRRAWVAYVAEAKRADTRQRRAARATEGIRARAFPR
jgi:hypothetical protein